MYWNRDNSSKLKYRVERTYVLLETSDLRAEGEKEGLKWIPRCQVESLDGLYNQ